MEKKDDELQSNYGATRCSNWGLALVATFGHHWGALLGTIRVDTVRVGIFRMCTIRVGTISVGTVRVGTVRVGIVRVGTVSVGTIRVDYLGAMSPKTILIFNSNFG